MPSTSFAFANVLLGHCLFFASVAFAQPQTEAGTKALSPATAGDEPKLLAHFKLDEPEAKEFVDAVNAEVKLIPKGKGTATSVPGRVGNGVQLDGNIVLVGGDILPLDRRDKFSCGAWINPGDSAESMAILSRMQDGNNFRGYELFVEDGRAGVRMAHQWEGNGIRVVTKEKTVAPDKWQHVLMTNDGSGTAAGVRIYVDGKPVELEITHKNVNSTIKVKTPFHVGGRNPSGKFRGVLDDVRVYDNILSDADVAALAKEGT
jgi:hypothetical protein